MLVHGSWHGAWCWERVAPLLRLQGHTVVAPDLPGHGDDPTGVSDVEPGSDVARVCEVLDGLDDAAILVGHSSGGMVISAVAEQRPAQVRALVYLAAFLLPHGVTPRAVPDEESRLYAALVVDEASDTISVRPDAVREVFFGDCSDADLAWASARLVPERRRPPPVLAEGEEVLAAVEAAAPRFYVHTLHDRALGPTAQRRMFAALPCRKVYTLATSHSPFLSAPEAVAECLMDVSLQLDA